MNLQIVAERGSLLVIGLPANAGLFSDFVFQSFIRAVRVAEPLYRICLFTETRVQGGASVCSPA
mgnify:CR=1 FL=1